MGCMGHCQVFRQADRRADHQLDCQVDQYCLVVSPAAPLHHRCFLLRFHRLHSGMGPWHPVAAEQRKFLHLRNRWKICSIVLSRNMPWGRKPWGLY